MVLREQQYNRTDKLIELEKEFAEPLGIDIREFLRLLYVEERVNPYDIADMLGVSARTIYNWLDDMDLYGNLMTWDPDDYE